jgi:hypothetical protein
VDRHRALEQRARAYVVAAVELRGALVVETARDVGGIGLGTRRGTALAASSARTRTSAGSSGARVFS